MSKDAVLSTGEIKNQLVTKTNKHMADLVSGSLYTTTALVKCCLLKYLGKIENKGAWKAPAGILLTIVLTFATTEFKKTFGISSEGWKILAVSVGLLCIYQIIRVIPAAFSKHTVDDIILEIQRGNQSIEHGEQLKKANKF